MAHDLQRLHAKGTLSAAVQMLTSHACLPVLGPSKRVRQCRVSAATGRYCQARLKLPKLVAVEVSDHIVQQLEKEIQEGWPGLQRPVFLIDGSSLRLQHKRELVKAFPPARSQKGERHWPVLKIVVFHDVFSGLAWRPSWGAMYGKQAVSEQALACQALAHLQGKRGRAGGIETLACFKVAYAAEQSQRGLVFRLTGERARKMGSATLVAGLDQAITWTASRWDRSHYPELPQEAQLTGRLLVYPHPSQPAELLYLFTTLALPADQVLELYKLRWNSETDLRSLKQTVRLQQLTSKSVDMMEKELLLAVAAYNLLRAVMCLAARAERISPRRLSFSRVQVAPVECWELARLISDRVADMRVMNSSPEVSMRI